MLTKNHFIWNFNATDLLYTFIEVDRNALELSKMSKHWGWKKTGLSKIKYLLAQIISDKTCGTKWSNPVKLGKKKSLVSVFACFLTAIREVQVLEGRMHTRLCAHPYLRFF